MKKFRGVFLAVILSVSGMCSALRAESTLTAAAPEQIRQGDVPAAAEVKDTQQSTAAAVQNTGHAPQQESEWFKMGNIGNFFPIILIAAMIFLMFRANKKQQRQRMEMLDKIVKGSKVMLNSGVMGKVSEVREKEFLVEIAENVKVLVIREGVTLIEDDAKKEEKK